jgi:hypothetical protein
VTAYALSFGSLLLFCGRLADLAGRKVVRRHLRGRRGHLRRGAEPRPTRPGEVPVREPSRQTAAARS